MGGGASRASARRRPDSFGNWWFCCVCRYKSADSIFKLTHCRPVQQLTSVTCPQQSHHRFARGCGYGAPVPSGSTARGAARGRRTLARRRLCVHQLHRHAVRAAKRDAPIQGAAHGGETARHPATRSAALVRDAVARPGCQSACLSDPLRAKGAIWRGFRFDPISHLQPFPKKRKPVSDLTSGRKVVKFERKNS
jgi:hypothetical protein